MSGDQRAQSLTLEQKEFIASAARFLESPSLIMKLTDLVGKPLEMAQKILPPRTQKTIQKAVSRSLNKALEVALLSQDKAPKSIDDWTRLQKVTKRTSWTHVAATSVTGATGGFFGLIGLGVELPLSTTLILRSISSIAASHGVDLSRPENRLECLYVFTLGTKGRFDDSMDSSYLSSRLAFTQSVRKAAEFIALHGTKELLNAVQKGSAPALVRLISRVAASFEVAVSEKVLAGSVPVIGAIGGAAINAAFTDFFSEAARFHFGLRKLEALFGEALIQEEYQKALLR